MSRTEHMTPDPPQDEEQNKNVKIFEGKRMSQASVESVEAKKLMDSHSK